VDSALVRFDRREPPVTDASREEVFAVVDTAFAQRRKMLRSALSALAGSADAAVAAIQAAGVDPQARGEVVDIAAFARIASALAARSAAAPSSTVTPEAAPPGEPGRLEL
jgi:16S rRNA (adenine1518-N6/adenine1519-N6)-dimethyltransferase